MKALVIMVLFSSFLMAQVRLNQTTKKQPNKMFDFSNKLNFYKLTFAKSDLPAKSILYNYAHFKEKQIEQKSSLKFNKEYLSDLGNASKKLKTSMYLKYGASGLDLFRDIILFSTNLGSTSSYNLFTVSSNFLDISSSLSAGNLSNDLQTMALKFKNKNSIHLIKASKEMKKYKNYNIASSILSFVAYSTALYTIISSDYAPDQDQAFTKGIIAFGSFTIGAIVTKFLAVHHLEKAGQSIQNMAKVIPDSTQKKHWHSVGNNLIKSSKNWEKGFGHKIVAAALPEISLVIPDQGEGFKFVKIINIFAIVEYFVGDIYSNWISPFNLYQAGDNIDDLKETIKYQ